MDRTALLRIEEDPVLEQAADWFVELQAAEAPLERIEEWQSWLSSDERHQIAYRDIESVWDSVHGVEARLWPKPEEISQDRYDATVAVSAWRNGAPTHTLSRARGRGRKGLALAAALAIGVGVGIWQTPPARNFFAPSSIDIQTRAGERQEVRMSDGSTIAIGGSSSVSAQFTKHGREIRLNGGEAYFSVAKDPSRPFVVHAGNAAFTALGTQFNVRNTSSEIVVAVAEGIVQVDTSISPATPEVTPAAKPGKSSAALRLVAGEQLSVASAGTVSSRQPVDAKAIGGWRDGKLHYLNEPLSSVIADVRRYAARDIELSDPTIGNYRITGTVFENDIDSWLRTLEAAFPLRTSVDTSGKILLNPSSGAASPN